MHSELLSLALLQRESTPDDGVASPVPAHTRGVASPVPAHPRGPHQMTELGDVQMEREMLLKAASLEEKKRIRTRDILLFFRGKCTPVRSSWNKDKINQGKLMRRDIALQVRNAGPDIQVECTGDSAELKEVKPSSFPLSPFPLSGTTILAQSSTRVRKWPCRVRHRPLELRLRPWFSTHRLAPCGCPPRRGWA